MVDRPPSDTRDILYEVADALQRPIGWWLKEADARLDAAFARELVKLGVDRRAWQVLASLADGPRTREQLAAALAAFDAPDVVDGVVDGLITGGWVVESDDGLHLTSEGVARRREVAARVGTIRDRVRDALPGDDYVTLVRLLQRLVERFEPAP